MARNSLSHICIGAFIVFCLTAMSANAENGNGSHSGGECTECKWIISGPTPSVASNETVKFMVGTATLFENAMGIEANRVVFNFAGNATESVSAPTTPSELLAAHNAYRAEAGMPLLAWSTTLASYAQNWANYLVANNLFQHSGGPYGENLARGWPSSYWSDTSLVNLWGGEKQYFKCGSFPDVSTTGNWQDVGHYTQMIWPTTREVGCGVASTDTYGKCLVCEYNPPGNWIGTYICLADKIGVFRNSAWFLDLIGNKYWDLPGDLGFGWGLSDDLPVTGDWNGDGKDEVGVFRDGAWFLDLNGNRYWDLPGDVGFGWGLPEDLPVAGDWNGDGKDEVGVFRDGAWFLDLNGNRYWDLPGDVGFGWGLPDDLPIAGDWNRDGKDEVGVFRDGAWFLDLNGNRYWDLPGDVGFGWGLPDDKPVSGNWRSTASGDRLPLESS